MNHYKAVFYQNAVDGLLEIPDYIALDKPVKAGSFVKELTTSLKNDIINFSVFGKSSGKFRFRQGN
ncbi:hypothetical protein [Bathymodiolus thermophilus thioautotrophic gill symbiont]|uniref:Type II toxin-antitoxin system RelE/ParE family toxin n=1 Tax=Bathymodiolus thermophilus thioautotrophic gill symbiont TaxID=2360 RepID=A0A8H8X9Y6_9GAMM|nr:hypothetical protein [Bathymodiolus thermophilus thioautotrophic gill symbiont]CAB5494126.1 hypothetical protein THERMOS_50 [Bathymodiolus thermophilus thioautotrophic gill symbiont]